MKQVRHKVNARPMKKAVPLKHKLSASSYREKQAKAQTTVDHIRDIEILTRALAKKKRG